MLESTRQRVRALRVKTVGDIPLLKAGNAKATPERIAVIVDYLRKRGAAKPAPDFGYAKWQTWRERVGKR
jgi:hypothetical protein